jgi:hypothetical protein
MFTLVCCDIKGKMAEWLRRGLMWGSGRSENSDLVWMLTMFTLVCCDMKGVDSGGAAADRKILTWCGC